MSIIDKIRLHYPLPITELYTAIQLEFDSRLKVQKLVELFEGTVHYLALIGLASYSYHQLVDPHVEKLRPGLNRPSLGHWVNLLKAITPLLTPYQLELLGTNLGQNRNQDEIGEATRCLTKLLDLPTKAGRLKLDHFLSAVVEFRNKKFGHGSLSKPEAKQIIEPLQAALLLWLAELSILEQQKLVYLTQIEWQEGQFIYQGLDLNVGDAPFPFTVQATKGISNNRTYLYYPSNGEFLPLYPFFVFDDDIYLLYLYSELSNQEKLLLRCPYETLGGETPRYVDVSKSIVTGVGEAVFPPDVIAEEVKVVTDSPPKSQSDVTELPIQVEPEPIEIPVQPNIFNELTPQPASVVPVSSLLVPPLPPRLTFDNLTQQLEQRIRKICRLQARFPVLWIVGDSCAGKTAIVRTVCQKAGWHCIDFTLDPGYLDSFIGQEETYQPEDFLEYLHSLCRSATTEVIVLDEIEPLLSWWSWDDQEAFFQKIARATRLRCGVVLVTRLRTPRHLEKIVPSKDHIFEIPSGVEL